MMVDELLECQTCGRVFPASYLSAVRGADEPGCPSCGSTNYLEVNGEEK